MLIEYKPLELHLTVSLSKAATTGHSHLVLTKLKTVCIIFECIFSTYNYSARQTDGEIDQKA